MSTVKYQVGGNNALLKVALLEAWKGRCYWCAEPVAFHQAEIDHVLPRTWDPERLSDARRQLGLRDGDVHAPANLAPIHGQPCNNSKSNAGFPGTMRFADLARRAEAKSNQVIKKVIELRSDTELSKAGEVLLAADLSDKNVRDQVETYQEALRSALWGPQHVRTLRIERDPKRFGESTPIRLVGEETLAAVSALDLLFPGALEGLLDDCLESLTDDARGRVHDHFEGMDVNEGLDPVTAGEPDEVFSMVEIDSMDLARDEANFTLRMAGRLELSYSASLAVQSPDGGELLDDHQGDAFVDAPIEIMAEISLHSAGFDLLDVAFAEFDPEYSTTLDHFDLDDHWQDKMVAAMQADSNDEVEP